MSASSSHGPAPDRRPLLKRLADLWLTYLKGQLLMSLIVGGITWVVGAAIGLPGAYWLGLVAGALQTVPGVGPLIAAVPAVVVAATRGSGIVPVDRWAFALIVAGAYLAIQQIAALAIEPRLMGSRLDLSPGWVLVCVVVGTVIAGIPGAYLAVPALVSVREMVRYCREGRQPTQDTR